MTREHAKFLLEAYRTGESMDGLPELAEALEFSYHDPELSRLREANANFDAAFKASLGKIVVPPELKEKILQRAAQTAEPVAFPQVSTSPLKWLHLVPFAAAASLTFLLAIHFTFWHQPATRNGSAPLMTAASPFPMEVFQLVDNFLSSHRPSFASREAEQLVNFIQNQGGPLPASLPRTMCWSKSVACDVVDYDGIRISILCFQTDNDEMVHLITFSRAQFPGHVPDTAPLIHSRNKGSFAAWTQEHLIHVLYSADGEDNLRAALDI